MSNFQRGRGSMVRRGNGGNRDFSNLPPLQNVVGMIDAFHFEQRGKSNPDKDKAEIYLVHSIPELGITAEFDDTGAPLTKMTIMMPEPKGGAEGRRDLLGLSQKKAGGAPMEQGSLAIFEKCWFDKKEGILKAHFSRGGPTAEDQSDVDPKTNVQTGPLKNLYSNIFVCVLPERMRKQEDGTFVPVGKQQVMIGDQLGAQVVEGDESLVANIEALVANNAIGTAGFQLHCRALADEALSDDDKIAFASNPETRVSGFVAATPRLVEENGQKTWVPLTTDEILKKLWEGFPDLAERWGQPGFQFEFVPMMVVNQGTTLVPSSKKNEKGKDNSKIFALYGDVHPNTEGALAVDGGKTVGVFDFGWTLSHVIVERMARDSGIWYSTYQNPVSTRSQMYALPDIPTPNMPAYHVAAVTAEATRLGEAKASYFRAKSALEKANAAEQAPDAGGPAPR